MLIQPLIFLAFDGLETIKTGVNSISRSRTTLLILLFLIRMCEIIFFYCLSSDRSVNLAISHLGKSVLLSLGIVILCSSRVFEFVVLGRELRE